MSELNKAIIRRFLEDEISNANFDLTEELVHPDFFDHTNPPELQRGIAGHQGIVSLFKTAFPDAMFHADDLIAEGDKVVARTTFSGTHAGDFFGIPPTNKRVSMAGVHIMRLKEGKVVEHWGSNDDLGLMRQLGVIPG